MILQCKKADMFGNISTAWKITSVLINSKTSILNVTLAGYTTVADIKSSPIIKQNFQLGLANYSELINEKGFDAQQELEKIYKDVSKLSYFAGSTLVEENTQSATKK